MIPSKVMAKLATLGLSEEQAIAVAWMLSEVERATREEVLAHLEPSRESARMRVARYHERLGLSARDWRDIRNQVLERDGRRCAYCGSLEGPFHVDHVVPLIQGGTSDLDNLTVACRACNCGKSGRTPTEWMAL
jgi:5-methylcytosine-specific restriction endonuclease McrA